MVIEPHSSHQAVGDTGGGAVVNIHPTAWPALLTLSLIVFPVADLTGFAPQVPL